VIKLFISAEFNRFIEYYERAGDLNSNEKDTRSGKSESFGSKRGNDSNKTRFFVNIGKRDGLNVGGLLRVVCDSTGLKSNNVGRIDIMASFAFFDTDTEYADKVISKLNGVEYEGHKVSVEISGDKGGGGGGGSDDGRGRRDFKPRRTNLRDERPKRRESSSNHKPRRY
jgi:ATP-dependent RNA helicase DeaD